jgi:hypothetical protein
MKDLGFISATPISPPSGPATSSFNGIHSKSKILADASTRFE